MSNNLLSNNGFNAETLLPATLLCLTFPFVSLTTKCLLTSNQCTRWGILKEGADYGFPLTTAAFHLLLVGTCLLVVNQGTKRLSGDRHPHPNNNSRRSSLIGTELVQQRDPPTEYYTQTDDVGNDNGQTTPSSSLRLPSLYAAVGIAVGAKYVVGHWSLKVTPVGVFELFHCLNIVSISLLAYILLGECLTKREAISCAGIVVGSALMVQNHDSNGAITLSILTLILNLLNCLLAGALVVLLRLALVHAKGSAAGVLEVTAYKMFLGGLVAGVAAFALEDATLMTLKQSALLVLSSVTILIYHLTLGFLCSLASASFVGIVEALKPVPALIIVALIKGSPLEDKTVMFWVGSIVILVSAIAFKLGQSLTLQEEEVVAEVRTRKPKHQAFLDISDHTDTTIDLDHSNNSLNYDCSQSSCSESSPLLDSPPISP